MCTREVAEGKRSDRVRASLARPGEGRLHFCKRCGDRMVHTYRIDRLFLFNRRCWVCAGCGKRLQFVAIDAERPE